MAISVSAPNSTNHKTTNMKTQLLSLILTGLSTASIMAQTNTFPASGNVGIGTLSPATSLQVIGTARFGTASNYVQAANNGNLSFSGTASYLVGGNKYAFRYSGNQNYGLYFNSTQTRFEFRDGNARPVFYVDANIGDAFLLGGLQIGNSALNTTGNIRWTGTDFEGYTGTAWTSLTGKNSWGLKGNSNTDTAVNFIGTIDNEPILFKVANTRAGSIGYFNNNTSLGYKALFFDAGIQNTAFGSGALSNNTSQGQGNTAVGNYALGANTSGDWNTGIGLNALSDNTTGVSNTAVGHGTLGSATTGSYNAALGDGALGYNSTGQYNSAVGYNALATNTGSENTAIGAAALSAFNSGSANTATGAYALQSNAGSRNTAVGINALKGNTSASDNTAMGSNALKGNTTGTANTAIGADALTDNQVGDFNTAVGNYALHNDNGSYNCALGTSALQNNTGGQQNVAIGYTALIGNTTGNENTAIGTSVCYNLQSGSNNTVLGSSAMANSTIGSYNTLLGSMADLNLRGTYNTCIGYNTRANLYEGTNSTAIGYNAATNASNQVRIGNSSVTSIGGYVNWSNISDGRYKKEIKENVPGLDFIRALKPVTYHLDIKGINTFLRRNAPENKQINKSPTATPEDEKAIAAKEHEIVTGFVAQDVEKAAKKLGYKFSGVDAPKNENDLYGLRYAEFVVPLTKAVQELADENDELKKKMQQQQQQIDELRTLIMSQQSNISSSQSNALNTTEKAIGASLMQNIPNPANNSSVIQYSIPANFSSARLIITDRKGAITRSFSINSKGNGQVVVNTSNLASGTYLYSLQIDGRIVAGRQMVVAK